LNGKISAQAEKIGEDTYSSAMLSAHRYIDWMLSPFKPHLRGDIVEVGIGHGAYYEALKPFGVYLGLDIDERSVAAAKARYPEASFAQADILEAGFLKNLLPGKADVIVSINVLEHIDEDVKAVWNLVDALKPGGHLLVIVPAMKGLYNDLDRLAGHHRRYGYRDFDRMLASLPVEVENLFYFNPVGALGWWANRFRRHDSLNDKMVNAQIEIFDKYVLPVSRLINPVTKSFFGQSLVCMAKRL
jgi:SAM-dependent methyltransferase